MKKRLTICLILFIGIIFIEKTIPQTNQPEFTIGAFMDIRNKQNRVNPELYNSFKSTGMNTIVQYAGAVNKQYLTDPTLNAKLIAENDDSTFDYITYYSTGFYSRWESEERQWDGAKIGVKHTAGREDTLNGLKCWTTKGIIGAKDSIVYGPHYSQEKKYKRGYYPDGWYSMPVKYSARFRMALENNWGVGGSQNVCRIKVVHRYSKKISQCQYIQVDTTLLQRTLTVADFNPNGQFSDYNIGISPNDWYQYDSRFFPLKKARGQMPEQADECPSYLDVFADNGIQFCVDWLREDTLCTLYIDYAEVYDDDGWKDYIFTPNNVKNRLETYIQSYSNWPNLVYWYGHDEPSSIDAIVPMKTVDSLVRYFGGAPVITALTIAAPPYWSQPPYNGAWFHRIFLQNIKLDPLMLNDFPYLKNSTIADVPFRLELSRSKLHELHTYNPDFWYVGQSFGEPTYNRKPDSTELKASIMLALAHGVKGILFWRYDSDSATGYDCIVGTAPSFERTELSHVLKNNFVPRLKGTLGSTLLGLNYTDDYVRYRNGLLESSSNNYLSLFDPQIDPDINFHAGMLVFCP